MALEEHKTNMVIYFYRDNKAVEIDEGSVITQNYNETLDSATIKISNLLEAERLDLEPYDKVLIADYNGDLNDFDPDGNIAGRLFKGYFCIDTYSEIMICDNPKIYNYEISLFSETKLLEGIILPNISITPLKGALDKRSVWYYIEQYVKEYASLEKWYIENGWYSNELKTKFDNIECPEMQWNMPTLREVLNDLMMVGDCIVIMQNRIISFIDITEKKSNIHESLVRYVRKSQSSADYVSELQMNMVNVLQTKQQTIDNTVNTTERLTFTCSETLFKDSNIELKVEHPILRIVKLTMHFLYHDNGTVDDFDFDYELNFDLTWLIKEKAEYDILPVFYQNPTQQQPAFKEWNKYQPFALYFNRYDNEIHDFALNKKIQWPWWTQTWEYLTQLKVNIMLNDATFCSAFENAYYDATGVHISATLENLNSLGTYDYTETYFEIEYETIASQMFRAGKNFRNENKNRNSRVIIDNQTNSFVDAKVQGDLEYQKANRLGNQQLVINMQWRNPTGIIPYTMPKIGYVWDSNYIIYQCEYQIFKNHIEITGIATKDYLMKNYFTGIKSKVRTWVNAKDEALERHDLNKYYLEFSKINKSDNRVTLNYDISLFLSPLDNSYIINPLQYALCRTRGQNNDGYYIQQPSNNDNEFYIKDLIGRIIGNSLVFTFGFDDNCIAGKWLDYNAGVKNGGRPMKYYSYTDERFEFNKMWFIFSNEMNVSNFSVEYIYKQPLINESRFDTILSDEIELHKDNKEIFKLSTQLEFCSDTNDIEFTEHFLKLQTLINSSRRLNPGTYDLSETFLQNELEEWNGDTHIQNGRSRNFIVQNDAWKGINILQYININDIHHTGSSGTIDEEAIVGYNIDTGELIIRFKNTDFPNGSDYHVLNTITVDVEFTIDAQYHIWKKIGSGSWAETDWTLNINGNEVEIDDYGDIDDLQNTQIKIVDTQSDWDLLYLKGLKTFYLNILKYRN